MVPQFSPAVRAEHRAGHPRGVGLEPGERGAAALRDAGWRRWLRRAAGGAGRRGRGRGRRRRRRWHGRRRRRGDAGGHRRGAGGDGGRLAGGPRGGRACPGPAVRPGRRRGHPAAQRKAGEEERRARPVPRPELGRAQVGRAGGHVPHAGRVDVQGLVRGGAGGGGGAGQAADGQHPGRGRVRVAPAEPRHLAERHRAGHHQVALRLLAAVHLVA